MRMLTNFNLLFAASALISVGRAKSLPSDLKVSNRALSNAPSGDYAPSAATCPSTSLLRTTAATVLSDGETAFMTKRKTVTDAALTEFLNRVSLTNFDVETFMDSYSPTIGIALSGGGYRAMLNGAGSFAAFDSRTRGSSATGQLGGLLQSAKYITALSGGSWLLGSVVINNFTTIDEILVDGLWDLNYSLLDPDGLQNTTKLTEYWEELGVEVADKKNAGFEVSMTDYFGRALSRQFFDWKNGGPAVTFSSIALTTEYTDAEMPFPILVAAGRLPDTTEVDGNSVVFEFNPLELGTFDERVHAFTNLEYIGSAVTDGVPNVSGECVRGFDNAGFILSTSSNIFSEFFADIEAEISSTPLDDLLTEALSNVSATHVDVANYNPNPFYGVSKTSNPFASATDITMVDGGFDGQLLPLYPLIQPIRSVDVIFAMDNSADTVRLDGSDSYWPNGTALIATYERSLNDELGSGTLFPAIPDANTFVNRGLNKRPTFFGCTGTNITAVIDDAPPLIIWIPNAPYSYLSNISSITLEYTDEARDAVIQNGYNVATMGNATLDSTWPACVACAIMRRTQERNGVTQSKQCEKCFDTYCWDGVRNSTTPTQDYNPDYLL
ncbi:Lysophospholipase 1 [Rhizina undulata]